jgi:hypothetical protein
MALSDIYAPAVSDEETKKKRRDLASKLWQAKESGLSAAEAARQVSGVDVFNPNPESIDTKFGTGLSEQEILGFTERLYSGKYDKRAGESVFDQQEREARERSKASGAFGGEGWRGQSSVSKPDTPRLDRLAEMQNEPVGSRRMSDSRRLIGSPASQMRRIARKASRAGINVEKYTPEQLKGMGFSASGIRSEEEGKLRREQEKRDREERARILKEERDRLRDS